jgi:hypothetical protein
MVFSLMWNRLAALIFFPQLNQDRQVDLRLQRVPKNPCRHFAGGNN